MSAEASSKNNIASYDGLSEIIAKLDPKPIRDSTAASSTLGFGKKIPIYHMGPLADDSTRRLLMMALTLCARCLDPRNSAWQTFFASYSILALPQLYELFRKAPLGQDYVLELYPTTFIDDIKSAVRAHATVETSGDQFITFPDALPNATLIPFSDDLVAASTPDGLLAHFAMYIFLLGKSNATDSMVAITVNRPRALIRRNNLKTSEYLLLGDGKLNPESFPLMRGGFTRADVLRRVVIDALAKFTSVGTCPETYVPLKINMELLHNTSQSYLYVIRHVLIACPFCLEIPAVRLDYFAYAKMVTRLSTHPDYLQPYYKFMMQDTDRQIHRRGLDQILGVATAFAVQTNPNMAKYRIAENSLNTVKEFFRLAKQYGYNFVMVDQQTTTVDAI